jgi:nucleotide-binding universal stress UspA family protein
MRLLLAIDGSKFSEAATQAVLSQCQAKGTEVQVLSVADPGVPVPTAYAAGYRQESLKRAHELVQRVEQALTKAGFKVETAVEEGDPKTRILDYAARWKPDLIVVGSHGRKGTERFLMGSVSEAVSRYAPCSVEIVRIPKA